MSSIKKNFMYNIIYQIMLIILPLITAPYIARVLGAHELGIYSYTYSIAYYFVIVGMLGMSNLGNRTIATVQKNREKRSSVFCNLYSIQFIMFVITTFVYLIYILFFVKSNRLIYSIQILYILSGMLDINWLYFGMEKFKLTVTRNIIIKLLVVISIFIFVKDKQDLWKYTIIMSVGPLISQIYLWIKLKEFVDIIKPTFNEIKKYIKPLLKLFIPVISFSIYKIMDRIMIGSISTYEQLAYYENAMKIVNIPMGIITALGTVMLPRMSDIISNDSDIKVKYYIGISLKFVTLLSSIIVFGLIGISSVLIPVYLGSEFIKTEKLLILLSVTVFAMAWSNVIRTQYLIPKKYDKIYIISTVVGAILNFSFNVILIPKFYSVGACIGTIVAEFSLMIFQTIAIRKELNTIKCIVSSIPYMIIGLIMCLSVSIVGKILGVSLLTLIIQLIVGGGVYFIMLLLYYYLTKDKLIGMALNQVKFVVSDFTHRIL